MVTTNNDHSNDFTIVYASELEDLIKKSDRSPESQKRIEAEINWIRDQRKKAKERKPSDPTDGRPDEEKDRCGKFSVRPRTKPALVGLALSGGGIRSATFNLGLLQVLANKEMLAKVDYLSTVSGGGYIGACMTNLLNSESDSEKDSVGVERKNFPLGRTRYQGSKDRTAEKEPVRHLRYFSNYLTAENKVVAKYLQPAMVFLKGVVLNFSLLIPYLILISLALSFLFNIDTLWPGIENNRIFFDLKEFRKTLHDDNKPFEKALAKFKADALKKTEGPGITNETELIEIAKVLRASDSELKKQLSQIESAKDSLKKEWYTIWILPGGLFVLFLLCAIFLRFFNNKRYRIRQKFRNILATLLFISVGLLVIQLYGILIAYWETWDISAWIASTSLLSLAVPILLQNTGSAETDKKGKAEPIKLVIAVVLLMLVPAFLLFLIGVVVHYIYVENNMVEIYALGLGLSLVFALINKYFINLNEISLHNFYRDRLSQAYLFHPKPQRRKKATDVDDLHLSDIKPERGPYHILNTTLNLSREIPEDDREGIIRNGESFVLTRNWCGSNRTGYCKTKKYEDADKHINLGTAMAISGAAANIGMAQKNIFVLRMLMGLLNVRLGYWALNPEKASKQDGKERFRGFPGSREARQESFGRYKLGQQYINLSDGGHFDNIGVYELLRRRCKYIIVGDAEADASMKFEALSYIMRLARIDFGIEIRIDTSDIKKDAATDLSRNHCAVGRILYPEGDFGYLLYCKASLTGDEPEHLQEYRVKHPDFPHQTTADQWFDENQFEAYRELGYHIGSEVLRPLSRPDFIENEDMFERLKQHWYPHSEAVAKNFTRHTLELNRIVDAIRDDERLKFMDNQIYPEWSELLQGADLSPPQTGLWLPKDSEQIRQGFYVCNLMIQLMENVYIDLGLESDHQHPDNRGWMNLFRHWAWSNMFRVTYSVCASTFGARFQKFCENNLNLNLGKLYIKPYEKEGLENAFPIELNPLERQVLQGFSQNGEYLFQRLHLFILSVSNPIDRDDQIKFHFGLALTDATHSIIYYRVQDHLRQMGLGSKALKKLIQERPETRRYSAVMLETARAELIALNPALAQEIDVGRFEQMCERLDLSDAGKSEDARAH